MKQSLILALMTSVLSFSAIADDRDPQVFMPDASVEVAADVKLPDNVIFYGAYLVRGDVLRRTDVAINYRVVGAQPSHHHRDYSLEILGRSGDHYEAQVLLETQGEEGGSCGPHDVQKIYATFNLEVTGRYVELTGVYVQHERTSDNCHILMDVKTYPYVRDLRD